MTQTTANLMTRCLALAEAEIGRHIEDGDPIESAKCFNLFTYLESLESKLDGVLSGLDFDLSPGDVARFLWCCLSPEPAGTTFRGMPILD